MSASDLARTECTPLPKAPKKAKPRKGVNAKKTGTAAYYKRRATALWGEFIHRRDRVCQVCGKSDGKLDAHHIVVKEMNATRTYEPNGILLCANHHTLGRESVHQDPFWAVTVYTQRLGELGYEALRKKAYDGKDKRYPASFWRAECERIEQLLEHI